MADIVLGAFRYCVNEMVRKNVPLILYKKARPLMLCEPGNPSRVKEWGLFLRLKDVKATPISGIMMHCSNIWNP
jgi:hypothetical protein